MKKNNHCKTNKNNNSLSFGGFLNDIFNEFDQAFAGRDMHPLQYGRFNANIAETEENYLLELSAPGRNKEDFSINVEKKYLTIETKKQEEKEEEKDQYIRREFHSSQLKRTFTLPEYVDKENISAEYKNGVLYVNIPKLAKEVWSQTIEVK